MSQMGQIGQTYLHVLNNWAATSLDSPGMQPRYQEFRAIVGSIGILAEPLSIRSLTDLMNVPREDIWSLLRPLHSVIRVPADFETPVQTLHLSFGEFLLSDKLRHEPFGVDGPATHRMLFTKCLKLLSGPEGLRQNLCNLEYPGQLRRVVDSAVINQRLLPAFQYACRYWVHHVQNSMVWICDDDDVYAFLRKHFLHWLEALSLMNRIAEAIKYIGVLKSLISVSDHLRNL
jgi:hypothetical protein